MDWVIQRVEGNCNPKGLPWEDYHWMRCMLISMSLIMCGPPSVHVVCSKSGWLSVFVLQSSVAEREGEMMRNRGNRKMSRRVNTETGVWQGTMIRFINQPMLFSLLGDCCKTLSVNWSSQCPTTETHLSISLLGLPVLSCIPSHISHTVPQHLLSPFFLIFSSLSSCPLGVIRFSPTKIDWPWKHPFCFHHHSCVFSSSVRGVSTPPHVSPDHWLAHNIQYFLQLEWNWAH